MAARWSLVLAATLLACNHEDACDRAIARLARVNAMLSRGEMTPAQRRAGLEECRDEKRGASDPVLHCALESHSDDETADCISSLVKDRRPAGSAAP